MQGNLVKWLLVSEISVDSLGRVIINDNNVLVEISGAISELRGVSDGHNFPCGLGCGKDDSCGLGCGTK